MQHQVSLTNSELNSAIEEHIHSKRDREILRQKLIDGYTYDRIAEIHEMSPRQIRRIVQKHKGALV